MVKNKLHDSKPQQKSALWDHFQQMLAEQPLHFVCDDELGSSVCYMAWVQSVGGSLLNVTFDSSAFIVDRLKMLPTVQVVLAAHDVEFQGIARLISFTHAGSSAVIAAFEIEQLHAVASQTPLEALLPLT